MNGASFFFIVVYIHIFRGLYYGSYKAPRELLDARRCHPAVDDGDGIYGLCPAMGPDELLGCDGDHQLVLRLPFIGESIVVWLWGGFSVDNPHCRVSLRCIT